MEREEAITTPDGRRLIATIAGPDDGGVVFAHTGTPSGGRIFREEVDAGAQRGLQHVSYARPGYADSDRHAGRLVADCADDVRAIVDELGIERFHSMGWSGGGPHALATAALLPDRVISAATVVGATPHEAEGFDWSAGMGRENIEEMGLDIRLERRHGAGEHRGDGPRGAGRRRTSPLSGERGGEDGPGHA